MPELDPMDAAQDLLAVASASATLQLLLEVAVRLGVTEIDGVPLNLWHHQHKILNVNRLLREREPTMPEVAKQVRAILQQAVSETET